MTRERAAVAIGAGVMSAPLLPALAAAFESFPLGDDFGRAVGARFFFDVPRAVEYAGFLWLRWSGRFTHAFLTTLLADCVSSRWLHGLVIVGFVAVLARAVFGLCGVLTGDRRASVLLTCAALLALWACHPALDRTLYFYTDSTGIGAGSIALVVLLWRVMVLWTSATPSPRQVWTAAVTGALTAGLYEHAALGALAMCGCAGLAARWRAHPRGTALARVGWTVVGACVLVFGAPGNFKRQAVSEAPLGERLVLAADEWARWAPQFLGSRFIVAAVILAVSFRAWRGGRPDVRLGALFAAASAAVSMAIVLVHGLGGVALASNPKLPANLDLMTAMGLCAALLAVWPSPLAPSPRWAVVALPVAAVVGLAPSPRLTAIARNVLSGDIAAYRRFMERREAAIARSPAATVTVAPLASCPFPVCIEEPVPPAAGQWPSDRIAQYFGKRVLTAPPEPGSVSEQLTAVEPLPALASVQLGPDEQRAEAWLVLPRVPGPAVTVTLRRPGWPLSAAPQERPVEPLGGGRHGVRLGLLEDDEAEVLVSLDRQPVRLFWPPAPTR